MKERVISSIEMLISIVLVFLFTLTLIAILPTLAVVAVIKFFFWN